MGKNQNVVALRARIAEAQKNYDPDAEMALAESEGRVGTLEFLEAKRMANPAEYARQRREGHLRTFGSTTEEARAEMASRSKFRG